MRVTIERTLKGEFYYKREHNVRLTKLFRVIERSFLA